MPAVDRECITHHGCDCLSARARAAVEVAARLRRLAGDVADDDRCSGTGLEGSLVEMADQLEGQ